MEDFIIEVVDKSVVTALAVFAIIQLRRSYQERVDDAQKWRRRWEERLVQEREDKVMVTDVLREVSARLAEVCTILRSLGDRLGIEAALEDET